MKINTASFSAVLFDFDGVIANSVGFYRHTWEQFIKKSGLPIQMDDFEKENFFTKSLTQVCEILKEKYNIELNQSSLREETLATERSLMDAGLESDPSLIPFLEYCKNTGIKIAIGSNSGTKRIEWVLELLQIKRYFQTNPGYKIISADMLNYHKPDPEVWIRCAEMLEIPIEKCLVIEDGLPGLTGAKACGAQTVYYHRFCRPEKACMELSEKSVESFKELFDEVL